MDGHLKRVNGAPRCSEQALKQPAADTHPANGRRWSGVVMIVEGYLASVLNSRVTSLARIVAG